MFNNKVVLITGGTGSFGQECSKYLLKNYSLKKLIIFSRDELKQYQMQKRFKESNLRFFIGDIRDKSRLITALREVDFVIHAAALKHVPTAEYNPIECVRTNIIGAENLINAAIDCRVKKVLALSTDKATNPVNLYGATKLCAEKLFIAANNMSGKNNTRFSVVRYGNVINSRGSVIPFFKDLIRQNKPLPITDKEMTRFFISLDNSVKFVIKCLKEMNKGEVFIPKMPSVKILDLAKSLNSSSKINFIGVRPGEKLHELLSSAEESRNMVEFKDYYQINPSIFNRVIKKGKRVKEGFNYSSNENKNFLSKNEISKYFNF
jgi:UDP-N-acetylglucosamine 4,6-dehydratase/5-epimerase